MILHLILSALSFFIVSRVLPGFRIKSFGTALVCAIVMAVLGYVMMIVLMPMVFVMIIPAALFGVIGVIAATLVAMVFVQTGALILTDKLIEDFEIDSWTTALVASFLMAIIQHVLSRFIR